MPKNKVLQHILISLIILALLSFVTGLFTGLLFSFRIYFGLAYLFILPGYTWLYIFFNKDEINEAERFILTLPSSIILVSLNTVFYNKMFNLPVTTQNILWQNLLLILIPFLIIIIKKRIEKHYE